MSICAAHILHFFHSSYVACHYNYKTSACTGYLCCLLISVCIGSSCPLLHRMVPHNPWEQWFWSLKCPCVLTWTVLAKYDLMINVTGCGIICTVVTNMFISTIGEGTLLATVPVPLSANVSSMIWHLVWQVNPAGNLV